MRHVVIPIVLLITGQALAQPQIQGVEYWIDQADADNQRFFQPVATTSNLDITLDDIPLNGISMGPHRIHYRLKDDANRWSAVLYRNFIVREGGSFAITGGEYWFDQHDEDRTPFALGPGASIDEVLDPITMPESLPVGPHRIHYRLLDDHGQWSAVLYRNFSVTNPAPHLLTQFRYWTDQAEVDPADMHYVPIDPQVQHLDMTTAIAFCASSLPPGDREVFFQIQDNHGFWSAVVKDTVDVDAASTGPTVSIMQAPPTAVEPNTEYTYTAVSPTAVSFDWTFPPGWVIISQTGNSVVAESPSSPESGSVECLVTDVCEETAIGARLLSNVGIGTNGNDAGPVLMPNPSTGQFHLAINNDSFIDRLTIHNATGQLVKDLRPMQSDRLTFDLSDEANGLYTVRILQGDKYTKLQVMVQH